MKGLWNWALMGALLTYALEIRPRIAQWGATDEEFGKRLPGDERFAGQRLVSTRAITIDAPPSEVWPWLVQMGHGRAGFYSHDWVERLLVMSYAEGHSAEHLHPEFQTLTTGDRVPYHKFARWPVEVLDPPRTLIAGEWIVLEEMSGGRTRVLARTRGGWFERLAHATPVVGVLFYPFAALIDRVPGELLHHYMESGMLKGLKTRVETAHRKVLATDGNRPAVPEPEIPRAAHRQEDYKQRKHRREEV